MDKYVDVIRGWMKDPKSVSASHLTANYKAAREAYPISKPRTPSEWAGLDACFESANYLYLKEQDNPWYSVEACIAKYDLESKNAN